MIIRDCSICDGNRSLVILHADSADTEKICVICVICVPKHHILLFCHRDTHIEEHEY